MVSSLLNLMILRRDVLIWLAIMRLNFWREIRKGALDLSYAELVNQISKKKTKTKKKLWYVAFAVFHAVSTPIMACFKLTSQFAEFLNIIYQLALTSWCLLPLLHY